MDSITKKCSKCGEMKSVTEFYKDRKLPSGLRIYCKECDKLCARKWNKDNSEQHYANQKSWLEDNKEYATKRAKKYRAKNLETMKGKAKARYDADPEKHRKAARNWQIAHPDKVKETLKQWFSKNPDKNKEYGNARRARVRGVGGRITAKEWINLCNRYDNKCLCCGRSDVKLTLDHVLPVVLGGTNTINNAQPLCGSCNSKKNAKHIDYRK